LSNKMPIIKEKDTTSKAKRFLFLTNLV